MTCDYGELLPGSFIHHGHTMLQKWFAWALEQLDGDLLQALLALLIARPVQKVATFCAGTDSPLLTLKAFNQSTYEHFVSQGYPGLAGPCTVHHIFSCDIVPAKSMFADYGPWLPV